MKSAGNLAARGGFPGAILLAMAALGGIAWAEEPKWKPSPSPLMTKFAEQVSPKEVSPFEFYPRPMLGRHDASVKHLMGLWDYAVADAGAREPPQAWQGRILVPYPIESALSGVKRGVGPKEKLWCHTACEVEWGQKWLRETGSRLWLRFDGVSHGAGVWVNGREVGSHRGGDDGFCFDVTDLVKGEGKHLMDIVVAATPAAGPGGPHAATGITKPVWLEGVPASRIDAVRFVPDVDAGVVRVTVAGAILPQESVEVTVYDRGSEVARASGQLGQTFVLPIPSAKRWTPDRPFLYDYAAGVKRGNGYGDWVRSAFAIRKVSVGNGDQGVPVVMLNDEPVFLAGVVDASWWPDGGAAAPTVDAVRRDIERMKQLGFNLVRKSFHTDQPHWYWWCDRLGLMVWQELPSGDPRELEEEYPRIIAELGGHASITAWVLPAGLGADVAARLTALIRKTDPTRLVVGGPEGDVREIAPADADQEKGLGGRGPSQEEKKGRAAVLSPLGDVQWPVAGHVWSPGAVASPTDLNANYLALARKMADWRTKAGLSGYLYKQFADAGDDLSGLVSSDREAIKLDLEQVAKANPALWAVPRIRVVIPSGRFEEGPWHYTTAKPPDDWNQLAFDASAWSRGAGAFGATSPHGPAARTEWAGGDLWIRRGFTLDTAKLYDPWIALRSGGDVALFLNGRHLTDRQATPGAACEWVRSGPGRAGQNVLAAHARAEADKARLDVALVDLEPQRDMRLPRGLKPILDVWMRDPCVCLGPDGVYYLVGTGTTADWKCDGIPLYRSPDLEKWEFVKIVVHRDQFQGTWVLNNRVAKDVPIWAPELHFIKGTYWLTFCTGWAREGGQAGTGLLKSTTGKVEGPYELVNEEGPITPGHLDATLFQDDDGTVYFLSGGLTMARMKDDLSGLAEKPHDVVSDRGGPLGFEGIFLFKRSGKYYLDVTDSPMPYKTYDCVVGISDKVTGPYGKVHVAIPHGGHNMFFQDKAGNWWSTLFGGDRLAPFEQRPALVRVEFAPDGTIHPLDPAPR